ncbi:MAG: MerR family transcriptional regulator [Steroidobacteraceae bacterium]
MSGQVPISGRSAHLYSIKAVSLATGLTVETLRAWERRYGIVRPLRDDAGRRSYSAKDVARLRLLRSATDLGHPISRLASLGEEALAKLVADAGGRVRAAPRGQAYVERALDAAQHSDPAGIEEVLTTAMAVLAPSEVVFTVVSPLAREIGERWHRGEMSIAQEHMATEITRRLLLGVSRAYVADESAPALVLATLSGERHELGLMMCAWLAAMRRLRVHYLGIDCPPVEIAHFANEVEADAILISCICDGDGELPVLVAELAQAVHGKREIWLGGRAAGRLRDVQIPEGSVLLPNGSDLEQRLDLIAQR